jgi:hypothetical protein
VNGCRKRRVETRTETRTEEGTNVGPSTGAGTDGTGYVQSLVTFCLTDLVLVISVEEGVLEVVAAAEAVIESGVIQAADDATTARRIAIRPALLGRQVMRQPLFRGVT